MPAPNNININPPRMPTTRETKKFTCFISYRNASPMRKTAAPAHNSRRELPRINACKNECPESAIDSPLNGDHRLKVRCDSTSGMYSELAGGGGQSHRQNDFLGDNMDSLCCRTTQYRRYKLRIRPFQHRWRICNLKQAFVSQIFQSCPTEIFNGTVYSIGTDKRRCEAPEVVKFPIWRVVDLIQAILLFLLLCLSVTWGRSAWPAEEGWRPVSGAPIEIASG